MPPDGVTENVFDASLGTKLPDYCVLLGSASFVTSFIIVLLHNKNLAYGGGRAMNATRGTR